MFGALAIGAMIGLNGLSFDTVTLRTGAPANKTPMGIGLAPVGFFLPGRLDLALVLRAQSRWPDPDNLLAC